MIAAHLDNLLFLLLVAVALLFQFLAKAAGKTGKDQTPRTPTPRTPTPMRRAPTESDEDRIRKLLEALGQPPTSRPPPLVVPRIDIPPRPVAPVQPPMSPLSQLRREKARKRDVIPKEIPPPPTISVVEKAVPAAFEVQEGPSPTAPPPISRPVAGVTQTIIKTVELKTDVATLLASKFGLRDAIILREILGPPRGLRPIASQECAAFAL